jgi:hypothetical protein
LDILPYKGTLFVYGKLSNQGCSGIQPLNLIYRKKKMEGWLLTNWIFQGDNSLNMLLRLRAATACVHDGLAKKDGWSSSHFKDCTIDTMWSDFVKMYKESGFTGAKLRIRFE